jgi:hypothetical protein
MSSVSDHEMTDDPQGNADDLEHMELDQIQTWTWLDKLLELESNCRHNS